jgi:hypothetical protein
MPRSITKSDYASTPEDAQALVAAFEGTLRELNLVDREDPLTLIVAKKVIELAKKGERDPSRLRDLTMRSVKCG